MDRVKKLLKGGKTMRAKVKVHYIYGPKTIAIVQMPRKVKKSVLKLAAKYIAIQIGANRVYFKVELPEPTEIRLVQFPEYWLEEPKNQNQSQKQPQTEKKQGFTLKESQSRV